MAAVDVAVPATHHGATAEATVPASASSSSAVFPPPSAIVCIAASACVSKLLAYYGTLAVSLVFFASAVWPDRVDAVLSPLAAHARRAALFARSDLEADLRLIRDAYPAATEAVCAAAEECARIARAAIAGARRKAEAKWSEHKDAAGAAWALLRLAGRAARLAATVLLDDLIDDEKEDEEDNAGFEIGFCLVVSIRLISVLAKISGTQFATACLATTCAVLVLVDDWIDSTDDAAADEIDDADDTTTTQHGGEETETLVDAELQVGKSWQIVRFMTLVAYCADAAYLHIFFGPQPTALALLALCNLAVLDVGRRVELSPDDGESGMVGAAVDKWRRGAVAVFVASSVKVFGFLAIYIVQGFFRGPPPLSLPLLGLMGGILLDEEDYLLDLADSDEVEEDGDDGGGAAGSSEDVTGGVEEGVGDEANTEHSNASLSEYEEEANASSSEHEEEANASSSEHEEEANASSLENEEESRLLEEHCVISEDHFIQKDVSEDHEHPKEQEQEEPDSDSGGISEDHFVQKDISEDHEHSKEEQQEESDSSSGGSSDDSWDLVEVDPEMQDKDICEATPKSSSLFPWKQAA